MIASCVRFLKLFSMYGAKNNIYRRTDLSSELLRDLRLIGQDACCPPPGEGLGCELVVLEGLAELDFEIPTPAGAS